MADDKKKQDAPTKAEAKPRSRVAKSPEAWAAQKGTSVAALGAARRVHGWPVGVPFGVGETDYDEAVAALVTPDAGKERQTVEAHWAQAGTPPAKFAATAAHMGWAIGRELTRKEYDEAVAATMKIALR